MIGTFAENGDPLVQDMWLRGYMPPVGDRQQDIKDESIVREDGVNVLKFKKLISSGDESVSNFGLNLTSLLLHHIS